MKYIYPTSNEPKCLKCNTGNINYGRIFKRGQLDALETLYDTIDGVYCDSCISKLENEIIDFAMGLAAPIEPI